MRAHANGVWGAWSAAAPFTIDRTPVVGAFSAPPSAVSGTRRPVITFGWTDADGDMADAYDIEVYAASGGAPVGGAVYSRKSQLNTVTATTCSHTPNIDLPIGECVVRSRVRARGTFGAWSAYHPFTIVVAVPAVTWTSPAIDGGYLSVQAASLADPSHPIIDVRTFWAVTVLPPAGQTITKVHVKVTRLDGPVPGSIYSDVDVACPPAGGTVTANIAAGTAGNASGRWVNPWGTVSVEVVATASNLGATTVTRRGRFSLGEWYGAVALGDSVSNLNAPVETAIGDLCAVLYRAQTSPTAAAGGATWLPGTSIATVQAALPAANAYLGTRVRIARQVDDTDVVMNGGFEGSPNGWRAENGTLAVEGPLTGLPDGSLYMATLLVAVGQTPSGYPSLWQDTPPIPIVPGATYTFGCWERGIGVQRSRGLRIEWWLPDRTWGGNAGELILPANTMDGVWRYRTFSVVLPATAGFAVPRIFVNATPINAANDFYFNVDAVTLTGPRPGDGGMDRLGLTWESLG